MIDLTEQQLTIEARFERFHAAHPEVYARLVAAALRMKKRGFNKIGLALIWEHMRYEMTVESGEEYKLGNDYRAHYARLIMNQEPSLHDFFRIRELSAA